MLKKNLSILLFIALTVAFVLPVSAWDEVGHKLTAYIAWEHMSPEVREKVIEILLKAPEDSDLSVIYDRFNSRSDAAKERELFMFASIWSDVIRNTSFKVRSEKYNHGDWHYADIFWKQENGKAEILENFPEESGKAIPKLYDFEKILRDKSATDEEKAMALAWFLHVGGDIHNPLHNASRVTELEPKGDQGGNMFTLREKSETQSRVNLHAYWDGIISQNTPRKNDACDADYLAPIAKSIMKKYQYSKMQNRLDIGNYKAWNKEGFSLLDGVVYKDITRNQMPSEKYNKRAYKVGQEQIALAGYRLGETLNRVFGDIKTNILGAHPFLPENSFFIPCQIIRKVMYPVSKKRTPDQELRIALLDICPPNKEMVARPMTTIMVDGKPTYHEFDVVKVFESESEAKMYAKQFGISDANYQ